mgnify:CR=1 FL=1
MEPYQGLLQQVKSMTRGLVLAFAVGFAAPSWASEITVASFNVRIFSTGSRDDSELALIADRLQQFDLIAIQELRDEEVVRRTLDMLAARGLEYRALVSGPVGRGSLERYAFLWRPGVVQALDEGAIFPDPNDVFSREPYVASFRASNFDFTLITMHSIWGDSKAERRAEALLLDDVYRSVQDADPNEQDVIVLGDFNLPPEDYAFAEMVEVLTPLFTGDRYTTISENAKSLYDNIWLNPGYVAEYTGQNGIDAFDVMVFNNDDKAASLAVSDHRPVWARFRTDGVDDDASGSSTATPALRWGEVKSGIRSTTSALPEGSELNERMDINAASKKQLESLPGIGPVIAGRIISGRPYRRVSDLIQVKGIGPKRLKAIEPLIQAER